jgi:hypothetical protein
LAEAVSRNVKFNSPIITSERKKASGTLCLEAFPRNNAQVDECSVRIMLAEIDERLVMTVLGRCRRWPPGKCITPDFDSTEWNIGFEEDQRAFLAAQWEMSVDVADIARRHRHASEISDRPGWEHCSPIPRGTRTSLLTSSGHSPPSRRSFTHKNVKSILSAMPPPTGATTIANLHVLSSALWIKPTKSAAGDAAICDPVCVVGGVLGHGASRYSIILGGC